MDLTSALNVLPGSKQIYKHVQYRNVIVCGVEDDSGCADDDCGVLRCLVGLVRDDDECPNRVRDCDGTRMFVMAGTLYMRCRQHCVHQKMDKPWPLHLEVQPSTHTAADQDDTSNHQMSITK